MHSIARSKRFVTAIAASGLFLVTSAWAGSQAQPGGPAHDEKTSEEHHDEKKPHGEGSATEKGHAEDGEHHEGSRGEQPGSSSKEAPPRGYE